MQNISSSQASAEVPINENFQTLVHQEVYGKKQSTTTGLTWGYWGGRWAGFLIADGTLALTASATNYIVVLRSTGAISVSTAATNWDDANNYQRVYRLTTNATAVTATEDHRAGQGGVHGGQGIASSDEFVNAQTGTAYTYVTADKGKLVTHSNAAAIAGTLPQAGASFPAGWWMDVQNRGAGTLTITPTTSMIDGAASLVLLANQGTRLVSDGVNYFNQGSRATASAVSNTPAGNIAATNVQAAIDELDAEKALLAGSATQAFNAASVNAAPLLHLNDIINGDFRIAQVGTSFAAAATGAYDLDGWLNTKVGLAVFTVAQAAGSTAGRLARQVTITTIDDATAAGDVVVDTTRIEGFNVEKYVGKTFTVSFRARVPVVGIHCVALRSIDGTLADMRSYVKEINFPTANVWQDCSFTVVGGLPTTGVWNYTNGVGLQVSLAHQAGTDFHTTADAWNAGSKYSTANQVNDCATVGNVWAMEKVTMNLGTVAAVSEISFEQELVRCQRYFETTYSLGVFPGAAASEGARFMIQQASQTLFGVGTFMTQKRAIPTMTIYSPGGTQGSVWTAASDTDTGTGMVAAHIGTGGYRYISSATAVAAGPVYTFHFVAAARL